MVTRSPRLASLLPTLAPTAVAWLNDLVDQPHASWLWQVLIYSSLQRRSFEFCLRQVTSTRSASSWRLALASLLAHWPMGTWEEEFNRRLREPWLARLRGQRFQLVGDETFLPFWGRAQGPLKAEIRPSQPKGGTTSFFAYVTLCALWRDERIVLGVTRFRRGESLAAALDRLAAPLLEAGLHADCWLWDRGAANVATLAWWQQRGLPFLVAAPRRGPKHGVDAILTQLEAQHGASRHQPAAVTQPYTLQPMKSSGLAPVTVTLVVAWERVKAKPRERRQRGLRRAKAKAGQRWRAVAYFTDGRDWRGRGGAVQANYRRRQSIESSYRLLHASRARTSSRDPLYRLLLVLIAFLLQNLWVEARRPSNRPGLVRPQAWRFVDYCAALKRALLILLCFPDGPSDQPIPAGARL
jgi:putative transposase